MSEVMRTEYAVYSKGGDCQAFLDSLDEAVAYAETLGEGAHVEERVEYYIDKRTVWPTEDI